MDKNKTENFVNQMWGDSIIPELCDYIRIPNKSPMFDPDWEEHGYMDQAVQQFERWVRAQPITGMQVEVVKLEGRTPVLFIDIPGDSEDVVLLYGHYDKQPEFSGWADGLSPWEPVIKDGKLYGRGGADGMPELVNAGNTLLPNTTLKLSFRLPPTGDADLAANAVKEALEADSPAFARVSFDVESTMAGWNAPPVGAWLEASMEQASQENFGKPSVYMGTGGTIPIMGMLGEKFPEAQFLVTGLLGPNSNAHGPNEFLHIEKGKKLTCCVAQVLEDHMNC